MPLETIVLLALATLAVVVIFGPKRRSKFKPSREPQMVDLTALVERERQSLRSDFGEEPNARRSTAGAPGAQPAPAERNRDAA